MEKHLTVLGILFVVSGVLDLIGAGIAFTIFVGSSILCGMLDVPADISFIPAAFGLMITSIILIFAVPSIIAGWGILKNKPWGRSFGLVVSIVHLFEIPIGTALGIYGLWVLLNDETVRSFRNIKPRTV